LRRILLLSVLVLVLLPAAPSSAAVCADYPDQASAQAAGDTRDADGDGLFCEANPCPCSSGGGGESSGASAPADVDSGADEQRRRDEAAAKRKATAERRAAAKRKAAAKRRAAARRRAAAKRRAQALDRKRRQAVADASARLVDVIDGDTVVVFLREAGRRETVQLLGLIAPTPDQCGAEQARGAAIGLGFEHVADTDADGVLDAHDGKGVDVALTPDAALPLRDGRGRLNAYVDVLSGPPAVGEDGYDLGRALIASGWVTEAPDDEDLARSGGNADAQIDALTASRGAWGACP